MTTTDTPNLGINHVEQLQNGGDLTANEAFDTADIAAVGALRGNRVINSHFRSWQEGTTITAPANLDYFADVFRWVDAGVGVVDLIQSTDVPAGTPAQFSLQVDVTTIDATLAATDVYRFHQQFEGFDTVDFEEGTTNAKAIYLDFWVKSDLAGTYTVHIANGGGSRAWVDEYSVLVANTWERKTVTIPGETTGTWLTGSGVGMQVGWTLAAGTNFNGTPDTWQTSFLPSTSSQVNFMATVTNNFRLALPRIYVGSIPLTADGFPYFEREIALDEYRIRRQFERIDGGAVAGSPYGAGQCTAGTTGIVPIRYQMKRIAPTLSISAAGDFDVSQAGGSAEAVTGLTFSNVGREVADGDVVVAANLVAGNATILRDDGGGSSFIDVDARLPA